MLRQSSLWQDTCRASHEISVGLTVRSRLSGGFDRVAFLENSFIGELGDLAIVDSHDFGLGVFNIFILTGDPAESVTKARRVVTDQRVPNTLRSAYRQVDDEEYVILWPSSLKNFEILRALGESNLDRAIVNGYRLLLPRTLRRELPPVFGLNNEPHCVPAQNGALRRHFWAC